MRALTLWQPWASLCVDPGPCSLQVDGCALWDGAPLKRVETRSWPAPASLVGQRFAIHAATRPVVGAELAAISRASDLPIMHSGGWPYGAVVGTVVLSACVPMYHVAQLMVHESGGPAVDALWPNVQLNGRRCATLVAHSADELWPNVELTATEVAALVAHTYADTPSVNLDDQIPFGDFRAGRWAWLLGGVERFAEPIPARGRQGLWEWSHDG